MKNYIYKLFSAILAILLCSAPLTVVAVADSADTVTATIPVAVTVSAASDDGDADIPVRDYVFQLTPVDDAPAPQSDTVTITGQGSDAFNVSFSRVGVYNYRVSQQAAIDAEAREHLDMSIYYVKVTVTNGDNGGFDVTVAVRKGDPQADKSDNIVFDNTYDPLPAPTRSLTVKKTWTDNGSTRPASIRVELFDGNNSLGTVMLSAETGWSYTWNDLDDSGDHNWSVREHEVRGYRAEYSVDKDGTMLIHNIGVSTAERLIQTGQMNWPIPLLFALGLLLLVRGAREFAGKRDE